MVVWLILFILAMSIAGLVISTGVEQRMRYHHGDAWEKLSSPSVFWNNSLKSLLFVWSGVFRELEDQKLQQMGGRLRLVQVVILGSLILLVALLASIRPEGVSQPWWKG